METARIQKIISEHFADANAASDLRKLLKEVASKEGVVAGAQELARGSGFVYDYIEEQITPLGRKWYFLVNYNGTRIQSPAWVQKSARSKKLNEAYSLGSVRFALGSETKTDIRLRAENGGIRPNIRNSVEEAWERIEELKAEASVV